MPARNAPETGFLGPGGSQLLRVLLAAYCFSMQAAILAQETEPGRVEADAGPGEAVDATEVFTEPAALIDNLHGTLIAVMKQAAEMGYAGRYRVLEPVITAGFDTSLIVKVILSRHWGELNAQQQSGFVELFRRLSVATYASRFDGYDQEEFAEISREVLNRGRLLIKTELRRPERKPVRLDYLMHQAADGKWRIISVIANGVNDLSLKRAEYAVVIKERGFDALVGDIERKIKEMESGTAEPDAL
jgi:phospholipid transport system substrate-binding protein